MNPFVHKTAAGRYAESRPYYHPHAVARVRDYLKLEWPVGRALDVACGTGQSCHVLKSMAQIIVGTDIAAEMLDEACANDGIRYVRAAAEQLPFPDEHFDLITASSAFHWFERKRFLDEANRLLPASHWLVVYTNGFMGRMKENAEFARWMQGAYLKRYPPPPRHGAPLSEVEAAAAGFSFPHAEDYANDVVFSTEELAHYLTTQSNIIAAVEKGNETLERVCDCLYESLELLFPRRRCTFEFGGTIWYLQKRQAGACRRP
ncbi:MAG TPA: class I SAM-dependent methyltransferase [Candidatus Hydrogenedentes bacterium]|nr:class I SAM-dependent methyltransferase [Candidatus Hydrogenedentota bacterium]HIJ73067.1 class I SAM-dependent methyltransferase [Candidatus Hydrogenedentota bacterium]